MKGHDDGSQIPPAILQKLQEIRGHDSRIRRWTGLLRIVAIVLGAMLAAMGVDWVVGLYEQGSRWVLTVCALAFATVASVIWGVIPILRRQSLASLAHQVDLAHPALEERYLTLAESAESKDAPALRGSESMIRKVGAEAAAMSSGLVVDTVVQRSNLTRALQYCGIIAGALLILFTVDFPRAKILCQRFWSPGHEISLTQLRAETGDVTVGKGESVTLDFTVHGKKTGAAKLFIRSTNGATEVVTLKRARSKEADFVYTRSSVVDSFEYRARAGDGQTAWQRVSVADRPRISASSMRVTPPAYSRLPAVEEKTFPKQLRALEGSVLEVTLEADQPLASMEIKLSDGSIQTISQSANRSYRFTRFLTNTFSFSAAFTNQYHLDNQPKPTCEIVVYKDEAPSVKVSSPNEEITARPDDKVKIEFKAHDDFGIADVKLLVTIKGETNSTSVVIPIPLKDEAGKKSIRKEVELDLAKFDLKPDQELSYVVQVTDTKENLASDASPADQKPSVSDSQKHLAMNAKPSDPKPPSEGSEPPANDMAKRVLDAGQCSSCQPMRILVDEWGRSFEGQMREKLEIAIDPVLRQLDELLGKAQESTETTVAVGKSPGGLSQKQAAPLESSKGQLRQADHLVTDLNGKSQGTPYAFIGLQLRDIRDMHLSPARLGLGKVSLERERIKEDVSNLEAAAFEIKSAREKLAALTKSYAAVKRDYKLADAMQRLKKMHQIFLEDTQAMLGSKKPTLNPQERKTAEVDDEFVEKLRKLLEEKKKIMAELAKILADDPRMLRRFLAMEQLEATSLRDQMTLLAQRQEALGKDVTQWAGANGVNREPLLRQILASQASSQGDVAALAAKLHENILTWLPLDADPDSEVVAECRSLGAEVARLSGEAFEKSSRGASADGLDSAHKSLTQLRQLNARLPMLEWSQWTQTTKLKLFTANRINEAENLITWQSGWIKKVEAIREGDFPQAAEVDQHRLTLDTKELNEKLETIALQVGQLSTEIAAKAEELNETLNERILPKQSSAVAALAKKKSSEAATHQTAATKAFATGEKQFDELLRLIIAKLDAAPAPTDPGRNQSLEDLLAMLEDEQKALESLGIPCRPMNVSIMKDWMKPGSGSKPSAAPARAAQDQARRAVEKTDRANQRAKKLAEQRASELGGTEAVATSGPKRPAKSWNTLVSKLGDELRQGRDNIPPEQYRQAIEQYFNKISEQMPASDSSKRNDR